MPSIRGGASGPLTLLLGSIHCHSTLSDGSGTPEEILAAAAAADLDFVAVTDHVPASAGDLPAAPGPAAVIPGERAVTPAGPGRRRPVLLPGLEYSPPGGHYLVLGLGPDEVPDPSRIPGWPDPRSCVAVVERLRNERGEEVSGFIAHPDDPGNEFLKVSPYAWEPWDVPGFTGLEVWNLSTDWSRTIKDWRDILRAWTSGLYRAVPPPNPATLVRWDRLATRKKVAAVAGTDAHAYPVRWHGLHFSLFPYRRSFETLQNAVWISREAALGPLSGRVSAILEALGRGRSFLVNRAWGHPLGFAFEAQDLDSRGVCYRPGDVIEAGRRVRFSVTAPIPGWIRLVRNGRVEANTFGDRLAYEPWGDSSPEEGEPRAGRQEAWRVEVWTESADRARAGSGLFLWILSNFIYRENGAGDSKVSGIERRR